MTYMLRVFASPVCVFGPFDTEADALQHGAMYCQDFRYEAEQPPAATEAQPQPRDEATVETRPQPPHLFDDLAAFLRRERNSLHYQSPNASEFGRGYTTAIDGITARMLREFRDAPGFDDRRFLALVEGRIQ